MYKAAIFDMDGTILDTLEDLADSLNFTLQQFNMPTHSSEEVKYYVGNGIHKTVERAVPLGTSDDDIEKVYDFFTEYYKAHCQIKTRPYNGIKNIILALKNKGILTAVISNKNNEAVKNLCELMFENCFDYCLGDTKGIKLKPNREMVDITLDALNISPREAIYIGDSDVDLLTAKNSGMACISVTWGFRDKDFLLANGADKFANKPEDILGYFTP